MCLYPVNCLYIKDINRLFWNVPFDLELPEGGKIIQLGCGKCIECCNQYSMNWALRCMLESKTSKYTYFLTLTYKNAPFNIERRDYQLFLKRLRKSYPDNCFRYFGCGEYGSKGARAHYHMILFTDKKFDLKFYRKSKKYQNVYFCEELQKIWNNGLLFVGDVNFKTCKYTAKYLQKLKYDYYDKIHKKRPFTFMSLKPGIGYDWFKNNLQCLNNDQIYLDGRVYTIPRYFLKVASEEMGFIFDDIVDNRVFKMTLINKNFDERRKLFIKLFDK